MVAVLGDFRTGELLDLLGITIECDADRTTAVAWNIDDAMIDALATARTVSPVGLEDAVTNVYLGIGIRGEKTREEDLVLQNCARIHGTLTMTSIVASDLSNAASIVRVLLIPELDTLLLDSSRSSLV
jgi:hypothetical protein